MSLCEFWCFCAKSDNLWCSCVSSDAPVWVLMLLCELWCFCVCSDVRVWVIMFLCKFRCPRVSYKCSCVGYDASVKILMSLRELWCFSEFRCLLRVQKFFVRWVVSLWPQLFLCDCVISDAGVCEFKDFCVCVCVRYDVPQWSHLSAWVLMFLCELWCQFASSNVFSTIILMFLMFQEIINEHQVIIDTSSRTKHKVSLVQRS